MNSFNCDNILQELMSVNGNSNCFDCKVSNPTWASVNNGILLCLQCSQHHRAFGNKISWIRSLEADEWSEQQLRYLQLGGNNRLSQFFLNYPFPQHISPDAKYRSIAAVFYRKSLQSRVEEIGESPQGALEDPPTSLEGAKILDFLDFAEQQPVKDPRELLKKEDTDDIKKIKDAFSNMFNKTKNSAEEEAKKVQKKAVEIGEKAKQVSQQFKEQSLVAAEKVVEKTAQVTKNTKQAAQEGMESLKKNIDSTWSFFKKKLSQPFGKSKPSSQEKSQPLSQQQSYVSKNSEKMSKIDPNNDTPTPNDDQLTVDEKYEFQS